MNEFTALRTRARDKRDKIIAEARAEYESALVQIATLEQDLCGKLSSRHKSIASCIESVIPRDEPFTTQDVLAGLEALDPGRVWRKRSVDHHFTRLRQRGLIKRIKRATIHTPAVYVRQGSQAKVTPLDDATLLQVIRKVLTRPMNPTEVTVAVVEAGYRSTMTKHALRCHVCRELSRGKFRKVGDKWVSA